MDTKGRMSRRAYLYGATGLMVSCAAPSKPLASGTTPTPTPTPTPMPMHTTNHASEPSAAYPFESKYVEVLGSKMHYVEQGEGDPILFVHGQPTWSYLWRNILPHAAPQGRAIAVDLIGFGKSDKPDIEYRFHDHVRYLEGFIAALGLKKIAFVVHDWGSALAFHYARRNEPNVRGIAFMEAILGPFASWDDFPAGARPTFEKFRSEPEGWDLLVNKNAFIEDMLPGSVMRKMSPQEMDQYRAPFLDVNTRKPLWRWPNELPIAGKPADVAESLAAYHQWLQETAVPKLLCTVTPGALIDERKRQWCAENMKNLELVDLGQGIHFVQEDHPHKIGEAVARFVQKL